MILADFLSGGVWVACWTIAYFFLRFARQRGDTLFFRFSLAFFLLGIEKIVMLAVGSASEFQAYVYLLRLVAFSLIIAGIISKNLPDGSKWK